MSSTPCLELFPARQNQRLGNLRRAAEVEIPHFASAWQSFAGSWSRLEQDHYMGDGGGYRFRRYAVFESTDGEPPILGSDQKHYQSTYYNRINGGIFREYPCFESGTLENPVFQWLLDLSLTTARSRRPGIGQWHAEAHQFRIVATHEEKGKPVPEGIHRDGVDFVFIYMVKRHQVKGGVSRVYRPDGHLLAQHKMREPLDCMAIDDKAVLHNVTPLKPLKDGEDGYRDVLVITVRAADSAQGGANASALKVA